jgi:hypothetical protein
METSSNGGSVAAGPVRYRCTACGNLTRFEVTMTRRTRAFHHFTIGGELSIEDTEVLAEDIESVVCRWCGTSESVVPVDDADVEAAVIDAAAVDAAAVDAAAGD